MTQQPPEEPRIGESKLKELGISPTPWKVIPYAESTDSKVPTSGDIYFANGEVMFLRDGGVDLPKIADARMIAASPKLYAACCEMLEYYHSPRTNLTAFYEGLALMKEAVREASGEEER